MKYNKYKTLIVFFTVVVIAIYISVYLGIIFVDNEEKIKYLVLIGVMFLTTLTALFLIYNNTIDNISSRESYIEYFENKDKDEIFKKIEENHRNNQVS